LFLYLDHVVVVVVVVVLCTGDDKMHGPEPLASTTQATIDAIVAKQEGESVGG